MGIYEEKQSATLRCVEMFTNSRLSFSLGAQKWSTHSYTKIPICQHMFNSIKSSDAGSFSLFPV